MTRRRWSRRAGLVAAVAVVQVLGACTSSEKSADRIEVPPQVPELGAAVLPDGAGTPLTAEDVASVVPLVSDAGADIPSPRARLCTRTFGDSRTAGCVYGDPRGDRTIALVGNSKTLQWLPAFDAVARANRWRLTVHVKSVCEFTGSRTSLYSDPTTTFEDCDAFNAAMMERLTGPHAPDVVVTALDTLKFHHDPDASPQDVTAERIDGVRSLWRKLNDAGVDVVAMAATPRMPFDVPKCLAEKPDDPDACSVARTEAYERVWSLRDSKEAVQGLPRTSLLDMNDMVCPQDPCTPIIGGLMVYRDAHHVTRTYMETLAAPLARRLDDVLS